MLAVLHNGQRNSLGHQYFRTPRLEQRPDIHRLMRENDEYNQRITRKTTGRRILEVVNRA